MIVGSEKPFVPRPDLRGMEEHSNVLDERDAKLANLHYRGVHEFAVGHGVSIHAIESTPGVCQEIRTSWVPKAEVNRVAPNESIALTLGMDDLARITDGTEARTKLIPLVEQYQAWIQGQNSKRSSLSPSNQQTLNDLIANASLAANRIKDGIETLDDPAVLEAFQIMNRAMAVASRQRQLVQNQRCRQGEGPEMAAVSARVHSAYPSRYRSIRARRQGDGRSPVLSHGGGKTEAYFGLAAFTIVLRRLRNPGIQSAGVAVLMRYTLRLLTLDQLGRAAALVCALEREREGNSKLGEWPFEIGVWVGSAATPNVMGYRGYKGPGHVTARKKTIDFKSDDKKPAPIPLAKCPWCGIKFTRDSFFLMADGKGNPDFPKDLEVKCVNPDCDFSGDRHLPILGVDERGPTLGIMSSWGTRWSSPTIACLRVTWRSATGLCWAAERYSINS
jgi:hypothetical protein